MKANDELVKKCRSKLIAVAQEAGGKIFYGELAAHMQIGIQVLGKILDRIYNEEKQYGNPDLTLVVVYKKSGYGRFHSKGRRARSKIVDPKNKNDVSAYEAELTEVRKRWS